MTERAKYDLLIIGAGITGLSTALAWTRVYDLRERSVLILERNSVPGGCVSTFARRGFRFDTAQIIPDVRDLLAFFEIDIPLQRFENYYARLYLADPQTKTAKLIPIPSSVDAFEASLCQRYPDEKANIRSFFDYCQRMQLELTYLKTEPRWYQLAGILFRCRKILANSGKTYHQFLQKFGFKDTELLEVLDTFSSFSGLSGNRCAALLTASAMMTTLKGAYRPQKGFIHFPLALAKKLKERGVDIRLNSSVKSILTEEERVIGVELENGERIDADFVVCTADTKHTYTQLLDPLVLKKQDRTFFEKALNVKMSPSAITIHLGLDGQLPLEELGFNCGYNVLTTGGDTHKSMFDLWEKDELQTSDHQFHLAVICPFLLGGGKQTLIIRVVPVASAYWIQLREKDYEIYLKEKMGIAEFYIGKVEEYMIPGLREHISFIDVATPATYKRYIGSPGGSQYDMLSVPTNFGKNRLKTRTPIKGLFVPKFSHGIWPSMQAGLQVVDMISGGRIMKGNASYRKTS